MDTILLSYEEEPSSNPYYVPWRSRHLHIFTDGSCPNNQNRRKVATAGWGYVATYHESKYEELTKIYQQYGKVCLDENDRAYFGTEKFSNNSAELSGIASALVYVLRLLRLHKRWRHYNRRILSVTIITDSKYCIGLFENNHIAKENVEMVKVIKTLIRKCRRYSIDIEFEHCFSHQSGDENKFNRLADFLAKKGATSDT